MVVPDRTGISSESLEILDVGDLIEMYRNAL